MPLAIVLTVHWHRRSSCAIVERYAERASATLWAHEDDRERIPCPVTRPFRPGDSLPAGLVPFATARGAEVVLWLASERALVVGDVLLGGKRRRLRVCPESWLPRGVDRGAVARSLEHLLELPVARVLCAHGDPVLDYAAAALRVALEDARRAARER